MKYLGKNMELIVGKKKEAHWEIDEELLKVYTKAEMFGKPHLEYEIPIADIENIDIYFISKLADGFAAGFCPASYAHPVTFNILTEIERNELIEAINYLKDHDIAFMTRKSGME
ncbi:hypothetical protein [uncultured Sharpea sp.]|nr:hypothetical protein [uncultured Sharpea sp.]